MKRIENTDEYSEGEEEEEEVEEAPIRADFLDFSAQFKIREGLKSIDQDGDGYMLVDDIPKALALMGEDKVPQEKMDAIFKALGIEENQNKIEYEIFVDKIGPFLENYGSKDETLEAFRVLDEEGKGEITVNKFRYFMLEYGDVDPAKLDEMVMDILGMKKKKVIKPDRPIVYKDFVEKVFPEKGAKKKGKGKGKKGKGKKREHEMKRNIVGIGFSKAPKDDKWEIVSAKGFNPVNIYIRYKLILPDYWVYETDKELEDPTGELDSSDVNREESTTHDCHGVLELDEDTGEFGYIYNFGFMLDWQLLINSKNLSQRGPSLVMEVCHIDSWGHYSLEGYSFCDVPCQPGFHEIECHSWKPKQETSFEVFNYYLGGAMKVRNLADVAASSFKIGDEMEASMNRMTLKTTSQGTIKLRFNVCHHNEQFMEEQRSIKRKQMHKQKLEVLRRTKAAKKLVGPSLMETRDGDYMNRFTGPG